MIRDAGGTPLYFVTTMAGHHGAECAPRRSWSAASSTGRPSWPGQRVLQDEIAERKRADTRSG
jgi:hypothetical protein